MKLLSSPAFLAMLAFLLSMASIGGLIFMYYEELWPPKQAEVTRFPSVDFDKDSSSYSARETHSMDALYKELNLFRNQLLEREKELSERERIIESEARKLETDTAQLEKRQLQLKEELKGYIESFEQVSASEEKTLKKLAATIVELSPKGAVELIKQYDKDKNLEQIVKVLEHMKPGEIAPIFDEMMKDDNDESTKLVETIAERLRILSREPTIIPN